MPSKKILFFPDVYQEQGHWYPAITLAQALGSKGHDVKYMGIADCKSIVEPYVNNVGNDFHTIFAKEYPFGYTKSHPHKSVSERWKPVHLWNIISGGLDDLFESFNPDLIISGYFASLETLLMHYKYGKKFMILTTYLRHPDDDPGIRAIQNLLGMSEPMARKIMSAYNGSVNADDLTVYDFVKPLEEAIELIPCPREFEFDNYKFDTDIDPAGGRAKFIEPCVTRTIINAGAQSGEDWKSGIPTGKLSGKKIIFATAGSQTQDYKDKARHWFLEMAKMMALPGMQDYHLVISCGHELSLEPWSQSGSLPVNASAHSWVPQADVLLYSSVAFIHGGLATIKECVHLNVPFVIIPLGKDQSDNALRASRKGIAQVAYAESTGSSELQSLLLKSLTDTWMSSRLRSMHLIFKSMEDSKPGTGLIDLHLLGN